MAFNNPWLALSTYEEKDSRIFKGRDQDAANMVSLLQQNDYVVCYAASGDGKSSLINAGVCPKIRKLGMFPIKIVFDENDYNNEDIDFNKTILEKIEFRLDEYKKAFIENHKLEDLNYNVKFVKDSRYEDIDIPDNLWWKLRTETIQISYGEFDYIPVLIFDQFEEVLRSPWKTRFFGWLEELSRDVCPDSLIKQINNSSRDSSVVLPSRKQFKLLLSMRYEYVGELDYWCSQRYYIPQLMRNRYFLKPLTREQAIEIINGQGESDDPISNRLKAESESIVEEIITSQNNNQTEKDTVSAVMLSLSCYVRYDKEQYQATDDLDTLIYIFYLKQMELAGVSDGDRMVLEEALITPQGTRVRIPTSDSRLQQIHINEYIDRDYNLFSTHLFIKQETGKTFDNHKEYYIEFTHDKLAEVIQKNQKSQLIPIKAKRALRYSLLLFVLLVIFGICYFINNPIRFHQNTTEFQDTHPIQLTKEDINTLYDLDYYKATSIRLKQKWVCPDMMDCYHNVLIWEDTANDWYCLRYAHNAKSLTFADDQVWPNVLAFGPNTEKVVLLSSKNELIDSVEYVFCMNKNAIIYIPYGESQRCAANPAFSDVCVQELGLIPTMAKRMLYDFHISHFDIKIGHNKIALPFWLLFLVLCVLICGNDIIRVIHSTKKERRLLLFIYCLICILLLFFVISQIYELLGNLIHSPTIYIFAVLLVAFLFAGLGLTKMINFVIDTEENNINNKTKIQYLEKERKHTPTIYIIYNSPRHKKYGEKLKDELTNSGVSSHRIELLPYEEFFKKRFYCHVLFIIDKTDLRNMEQNKEYFSHLKNLRQLQPIIVGTEIIEESEIPDSLKSIIPLKKDGTVHSYKSLFFNPDTDNQSTIQQLKIDLSQKRPRAEKKHSVLLSIALVLYLIFFVSIYFFVTTNATLYNLFGLIVFLIGYSIIEHHYSKETYFPNIKKAIANFKKKR